jgi:hypothetical protein
MEKLRIRRSHNDEEVEISQIHHWDTCIFNFDISKNIETIFREIQQNMMCGSGLFGIMNDKSLIIFGGGFDRNDFMEHRFARMFFSSIIKGSSIRLFIEELGDIGILSLIYPECFEEIETVEEYFRPTRG